MSDAAARIANLSPEQAARLRDRLKLKAGSASPAQRPAARQQQTASEPAALSFGQERLWFIDQLQPGSPAYNVPTMIPLSGSVSAALLRRCVEEIVRRHQVLRTTFVTRQGQPVQIIS